MLKLTSIKEAYYEMPAQLQQTIEDIKRQLYYLGKQYLYINMDAVQISPQDEKKLIAAIQAWADADEALGRLRKALQEFDYSIDKGEPVAEPGNPVQPSADSPMPPDNTDNPWNGEFYN